MRREKAPRAPAVVACGYCLDKEWRGGWHRHLSLFEVLYIVSGQGCALTEGGAVDVAPGDLILHPIGAWHQEIRKGEDFSAFVLSYKLSNGKFSWVGACPSPVIKGEAVGEPLRSLFLLLKREADGGQPLAAYISRGLAEGVYYALCRVADARTEDIDPRSVSARLLDYLEEHYAENVSLEGIAAHLNLNKYYIAHTIKELHGHPPMQLLLDIRMRHAKKLLSSTHATLAQIAGKVGYTDGTVLSRVFKQYYGLTPGAYRRGL